MTKPDARPGRSSVQSPDLDSTVRLIERTRAGDPRIEAFHRKLHSPR